MQSWFRQVDKTARKCNKFLDKNPSVSRGKRQIFFHPIQISKESLGKYVRDFCVYNNKIYKNRCHYRNRKE